MVEPHMVRVLGRSAFHDTALTSSGDLSYLGGEVCVSFFPVLHQVKELHYQNQMVVCFISFIDLIMGLQQTWEFWFNPLSLELDIEEEIKLSIIELET